jgi:hypothetical protein
MQGERFRVTQAQAWLALFDARSMSERRKVPCLLLVTSRIAAVRPTSPDGCVRMGPRLGP